MHKLSILRTTVHLYENTVHFINGLTYILLTANSREWTGFSRTVAI